MTDSYGDIDVTVVIPAYNEAARLPHSLPELLEAIRRLPKQVEIVLVDDGSTDDTLAVAENLLADFARARLIRLPWNCGKGAAVRAGVSAARGDAIVFLDADLAADVSHLPELLAMLERADVALGSRTREGADVHGRTAAREVGASVYQALVRRLTAATVVDTQCGFKAFRAPAAKLLFSMTRSTGFGFDVEILTLAAALGMRIEDCPIRWTAVDGGHVSLRQHGLGMLRDLHLARRHQQKTSTIARSWTERHRIAVAAQPADYPAPSVIRLDAPVDSPAVLGLLTRPEPFSSGS